MHERDYGRLARVGIITPQSNPTVEPEVRLLLPAGVSMLTTRCTSQGEPRERFLNYFRQLEQTLETFDGLPLEVAGFACTASSYLLPSGEEHAHCATLEGRFRFPVITAAAAIEAALRHLGARRIALICPYPSWLLEAANTYWRQRGFDIAVAMSVYPDMRDTRAIYQIRPIEVLPRVLDAVSHVEVDASVITGTGMPGLQLVCELQRATGHPAMNSNLCLAWACLRTAGVDPGGCSPEPGFPLLGGWSERLGSL